MLRLKQWDDTASWREFFETHWELIYNVARKAGLTDAEAQEAVQETVIGVARRIGEFKADPRRGSFKSWVLGQARWRIGDQFRGRKKAGPHPQPLSHPMGEGGPAVAGPGEGAFGDDSTGTEPLHRVPDPAGDRLEGVWNEEWEQHVLRTALDRVRARVSVKQFQMFDLHVRQGLSVGETARAVGATMASVYMAKSRVGRLMRQEVARVQAALP